MKMKNENTPVGFHRVGGKLTADGADLAEVAARFGTPCYAYSRAALESAYAQAAAAFSFGDGTGGVGGTICYAVKANGNLSLLRILAELGAGFDVVSGGELSRALAAGGRADRVVFSGTGKSRAEIAAAISAGVGRVSENDDGGGGGGKKIGTGWVGGEVGCFNVESAGEMARVAEEAQRAGRRTRAAVRVIPDLDAQTHPHLTTGVSGGKFGVPAADAMALAAVASESEWLEFGGLSCHLGSQIRDPKIFGEAARRMAALVAELQERGIATPQADMGGGFAVAYRDGEAPCDFAACARELFSHLDPRRIRIAVEPGRSLIAAAGVLLSRVEYVKTTGGETIAVADCGMNDFMRPSLYGAQHRIVPVVDKIVDKVVDETDSTKESETGSSTKPVRESSESVAGGLTVAGPVCESADILGRGLRLDVAPGDLIAIMDAGAYGMSMASNYNARPRPCEVLIEGGESRLIRRRETTPDLLSPEREFL